MLDLLYHRRSIRKFTVESIAADDRDKLIEALLLSPSSMNKRPWRFIIIEDKALIKETIGAKAHGTKALDSAAIAIAVIGLTDIVDVWVENCAIASIVVQLEAESLGLGSCWIQIRGRKTENGTDSEEYLRNLLELKGSETVDAIIAIGHPDESLPAYTKEDLDFSKITMR